MSSSKPAQWEQLGDYELLGKFAEGQSCVLHLAKHRSAEQRSALRAVKMPRSKLSDDAGFTNLLVGEAQLLACIQHPNVVAAHGFGRDRGGYVALDYVEGDDFHSLQAHGRSAADPRIVAAIIADVLQGLDAVHEAVGEVGDPLRAVHQAPHARHILVSTDGRARLADFTHARVQRPTSERRRPGRLHPAYRAPEQVLTPDQVDGRTDLFVLGIAFWEALSGQTLFSAASLDQASRSILSTPIPAPSQVTGQARYAALDRVCLRALEREPQARFGSAKEMFAAMLDAALSIGGIALPAEVARWVSVQAAAALQQRRALGGGKAADVSGSPPPHSIPQLSAALGARQSLDARPFDRSKTLVGTGLREERSAAAGPDLQATVLAEPELGPSASFRPSRPPSSRPPASSARPTLKRAEPLLGTFATDTTHTTHQELPTDVIGTEGVETERALGSPHPSAPATAPRERGNRTTEEYVATGKRNVPATSERAPAPSPWSDPPPAASFAPLAASLSAAPTASPGAPSPPPAASVLPAKSGVSPESSPSPVITEAARTSTPRFSVAPNAGALATNPSRAVAADFLRMSVFAIVTVLLGDGLIRLWFGSPYGAPQVAPMDVASDTATRPGK